MLELKNVNKIYKSKKANDTEALKNINISFNNIGMTFILGKSGCGKSTLLNILGGLDITTSGEIVFKGKSFNSFKNNDYDSYRNTSVGFVFQEYNLIEKFNVFDNVSYALKLQNKKIDDNVVIDVLDKVGLKDLAKRKVNELSGGQKQRVAIARALVKNPSIILADEPTGNLDSESSKNIFEILKNLSQERLVIVVSHDEESARTYGDRIISLQDGVVIGDTNPNISQEDSNYSLKKNHLPFGEAFRFAIKNIFGRKGKLILSIILISFALSFFGFAVMQSNLRSKKEIEKVVNNFDMKYIEINKLTTKHGTCPLSGYWLNCYNTSNYISEEEYNKLSNEKETKLQKRFYFPIDNSHLIRDMNDEEINSLGFFYSNYRFGSAFGELKKEEFDFKLIGSIPKDYSEIVIIKPLADFIIEYGVNLYSESGETELFKPKDYQELVSSKKELQFGNSKVIISGIIDDDLDEFEELKSLSREEIRRDNLSIEKKKIINKYIYQYPVHFYALEGFKDNIALKQNDIRYFRFEREEEMHNIKVFEPMKVYTENGLEELEKIDTNGIIVNSSYLDKISNGEFTKAVSDYIIKNKDLDPTKSSEEYKTEFVTNYIKENEITNKLMTLTLIKLYDEKDENGETSNSDELLSIRILGVVLDDEFYYSTPEILNKNSDEKYKIQLYVLTNDIKNYNEFFKEYPIDGAQYIATNDFIGNISQHEYTMKVAAKYIFIIGLVFSLFAVLVLFNFLGLSITDNKKEIGVLRALGTTKKDVSKIYSIQGLLIGFVSYLISILLVIFYARGENSLLLGKNLIEVFDVNLFGITFNSLIIMFVFFVVVVLLSVISVTLKISKMRPIDAINNK